MRRRDVLALIGGIAATWPLAERAQQATMPLVGYFSARSAAIDVPMLVAFRQGLSRMGFALTVKSQIADAQEAAPALGIEPNLVDASTERESIGNLSNRNSILSRTPAGLRIALPVDFYSKINPA
jgi:hypothetical protein